jgi:hypothetical protein
LRVSQRNVYHLMRGGRARWKMENETFLIPSDFVVGRKLA